MFLIQSDGTFLGISSGASLTELRAHQWMFRSSLVGIMVQETQEKRSVHEYADHYPPDGSQWHFFSASYKFENFDHLLSFTCTRTNCPAPPPTTATPVTAVPVTLPPFTEDLRGSNDHCVSWGDPHFIAFGGRHWDNYRSGDFTVLKYKELEVRAVQEDYPTRANLAFNMGMIIYIDDVKVGEKVCPGCPLTLFGVGMTKVDIKSNSKLYWPTSVTPPGQFHFMVLFDRFPEIRVFTRQARWSRYDYIDIGIQMEKDKVPLTTGLCNDPQTVPVDPPEERCSASVSCCTRYSVISPTLQANCLVDSYVGCCEENGGENCCDGLAEGKCGVDYGCSGSDCCDETSGLCIECTDLRVSKHLGCWKDQIPRIFEHSIDIIPGDLSVQSCWERCKNSDTTFKYFGVQNQDECWCGDENEDFSLIGPASTCHSGKGGHWEMDVYRIGEIVPEVGANAIYTTPKKTPLGCFIDRRNDRIFEYKDESRGHYTVDQCFSVCLILRNSGNRTRYFALQYYGRECWCGADSEDYALHGQVEYGCSEGLGGSWKTDIYDMGSI